MRFHVSPMSLMNSAAMVLLVAVQLTSRPGYVDFINDSHYCRCVQVLKVVNLNIFMLHKCSQSLPVCQVDMLRLTFALFGNVLAQ